jgi:hypothetical protein
MDNDKKRPKDSDPSGMTDFEENTTKKEFRDATPSKENAAGSPENIPGKPMSDMAPAGQDGAEEP